MQLDINRYYGQTAFELFRLYLEDRSQSLLTDLLMCLAPLVQHVGKVELVLSPLDFELACCDALSHMCELLLKRPERIPVNCSTDFSRYMWVVVRISMISSLKSLAPHEFDKHCVGAMYPAGRIRTHHDADCHIDLCNKTKLARKLIEDEVRFTGREKQACLFIAECLLRMRNNKPEEVSVRYSLGIMKTNFLIEYTEVLVRDMTKFVSTVE